MLRIGEVDVVPDKQIEITVAVHVQKTSAGAHVNIVGHPGLGRHIGKGPVAVVVEQQVMAKVV